MKQTQQTKAQKMPPKINPQPNGPRRIGIHLSTTGGVHKAVEHAPEIGANTLQIFSASPRMWRAPKLDPAQCEQTHAAREKLNVGPLVIHTSYLVNVCSQSDDVRAKSITAFRGEIERALALGAEYLVLHPGSYRGMTREQGLALAAESIARAIDGLPWQSTPFHILIENTAGAEFSLGGSFDQVAELIERLRPVAPVGACLDTCHTHVAGYDLVSETGYLETIQQIERTIGLDTVRVWHCNDAKAARGSKLDRHEHIGKGTIGLEPFRRLLNNPDFAHAAFIAETPVDVPGDEERNMQALLSLIV
ncbi:MAG TPA: deoxyribonuclease IV [Acidobacteriaceae bacterium]|nr:deoxyribonuclease IV [Acidobacteriaceae bacterium]